MRRSPPRDVLQEGGDFQTDLRLLFRFFPEEQLSAVIESFRTKRRQDTVQFVNDCRERAREPRTSATVLVFLNPACKIVGELRLIYPTTRFSVHRQWENERAGSRLRTARQNSKIN